MSKINIKKNLVDRVVSYFNPVSGQKRMQARANMALAESYVGASRSRRATRSWQASRGDSDSDLLPELDNLRSRSRDLARNNPLACGAISTQVTSIIGTGLSPQSQIDAEYLGLDDETAETWQRRAEREFNVWANSCESDVRRTLDFYEQQAVAFRQTLENGDVFALRTYRERAGLPFATQYQLIEGDLVSNPSFQADSEKLAAGVEKDEFGAPIAYHVANVHPGDYRNTKSTSWRRIEAFGDGGIRNMLHPYRVLRPGQTRGVPVLAPVIESFKQLGKYTEAELMAAVISGMFTVFVQTESGEAGFEDPDSQDKSDAGEYKLGNGAIIGLAPGETIETTNPGRPNAQFEPFVLAIIRQIGVALEMPYEVLIKHFTASYSASKGALIEAWRMFKARRHWFANTFCQPVYEAVISESIARGRLPAPGFFNDPMVRAAFLGTQWIGDAPGQLDPLKEVNAQEKKINLGLSTRSKEIIETNGGDFYRTHKQLAKEERMRKQDGLKQSTQKSTTPAREEEKEESDE